MSGLVIDSERPAVVSSGGSTTGPSHYDKFVTILQLHRTTCKPRHIYARLIRLDFGIQRGTRAKETPGTDHHRPHTFQCPRIKQQKMH